VPPVVRRTKGPLRHAPPTKMRRCMSVLIGRYDASKFPGLAEGLHDDPSLRVTSACVDGVELERLVVRECPHVVLTDGAIDQGVISRLGARRPSVSVVVLADQPSLLYRSMLLAAGVVCVASGVAADDVVATVHLVAWGWSLTDREREVLVFLGEGRSYAQVALAMRLAESTIKTHSASIRRKLRVRSTRELRAALDNATAPGLSIFIPPTHPHCS
jgi:DNA-binding NarL/FixJ family response regulator